MVLRVLQVIGLLGKGGAFLAQCDFLCKKRESEYVSCVHY